MLYEVITVFHAVSNGCIKFDMTIMTEEKKQPLIAFFDTKPYDREVFNQLNEQHGYRIKYFQYHITPDNCILV